MGNALYNRIMKLIDGKQIADRIYAQIQEELAQLQASLSGNTLAGGRVPRLLIVQATDDTAAQKYAQLKQRQGAQVGIEVEIRKFSEIAPADELIAAISEANFDHNIDGIMVQLPLYAHLQEEKIKILNTIAAAKDVDGLTATSLGYTLQVGADAQLLEQGIYFLPATVAAILNILLAGTEKSSWPGQQVLIINHSPLIGRPLSAVLLHQEATVTVAHEFTTNLAELLKTADIVITATGKPETFRPEMLKKDAALIDVTSVPTEQGVKGDFQINDFLDHQVSWRTPVPGGVGPVTVSCLLRSVVRAYARNLRQLADATPSLD